MIACRCVQLVHSGIAVNLCNIAQVPARTATQQQLTNDTDVVTVGVSTHWSNYIMSRPDSDKAAPLSDFFAATLEEHGTSKKPKADVSIERGAELIRSDRDGRTPNS